ncbi:hypothetical protein G6O69_04925 [Pseudenhygromyxa sp. WMMC2535]|uniref:hypothetical protein n=1 Tax=Pseudenhygromyxa sp. WMMC2535 TaxID=2712867 RepID=UPI001556EB87|nr:hypothetical protein [Pseudenhygromyxa sp. WMMC2535]NVB37163.1 hypothetical protein [Pseudenhygromyxa sp. WMMC2535]
MHALIFSTLFNLLTANANVSADDCGERVCLYPSDADKAAKWQADGRMSRGKRRKDAKKNRKRKTVDLSFVVHDHRASVFVDGRYWPSAGLEIKPGRHEVEVRDGETSLALGVLTVPRNLDSLSVEVHPERD